MDCCSASGRWRDAEHGRGRFADLIWFAGWLGALVVLFWLALRLPLQTRLSRPGAQIYAAAVVVLIGAVAVLANFALALHARTSI